MLMFVHCLRYFYLNIGSTMKLSDLRSKILTHLNSFLQNLFVLKVLKFHSYSNLHFVSNSIQRL